MKRLRFIILIILMITSGIAVNAQDTPPDWWQVYFTEPVDSNDPTLFVNGIDQYLVQAIDQAESSIDIAAFEFNLQSVTTALINAAEHGVRVRMVTDDEHGLEDEDSTIEQLIDAGIPVVDDSRSALMHNKFVIIDGKQVWTGSWNYTINGTFRNNNNVIAIEAPELAMFYTREFEEMFVERQFGPTSQTFYDFEDLQQTTVGDTTLQVYFAPEDDVADWLALLMPDAQSSIRFMAFSFTHDKVGEAVLAQAANDIDVQGIFEKRGSETEYSELPVMFCNNIPVRQDGNPRVLHHKVFIIDDETVVLGSFNFSQNADESNDENMLIIHNADIAAEYNAEFERRWAEGTEPELPCQGIVTVTATDKAVNLRSGPGTNYAVADQLTQGETATATGRNNTGDWLFLGKEQWIATWVVTVEGDINTLPVVEAADTPAWTPPTWTPVPDESAQPLPTQTQAGQASPPTWTPVPTQLPAPSDADGDGYADDADACPNQGDQGYGVAGNGCPNPPPDSDGDGYTDNIDACPNQGDQGYGVAGNGCPNPPPTDSDGDGYADNVDACPNQGDQGYGVAGNGCPNSPPAPAWNCGGDLYNCGDFGSCGEVMDYFNSCPGDPSRLDRDNDGVPCESLCG